MSRIAKMPIPLPKGVECQVGDEITIKGPRGSQRFRPAAGVEVEVKDNEIRVNARQAGDISLAGTTRSLLANMVQGVSDGFTRKLELVGVGFRAAMQGRDINLTLGFSHPVVFKAPEGITLEVPAQTEILVKGADKQQVGQVAAKIRGFRPPEPYKGKGVRYAGERITLKEAKKA